jgi:hypothetical protein
MKKLGKDLTTGDVVITWPSKEPGKLPSQVELLVVRPADGIDRLHVRRMLVLDLHAGTGLEARVFKNDAVYGVRNFDLTPAQMAADELLSALREVLHDPTNSPALRSASELIDRITPPEPPTLDEVLRALADVRDDAATGMVGAGSVKRADAILNRARRAGLL